MGTVIVGLAIAIAITLLFVIGIICLLLCALTIRANTVSAETDPTAVDYTPTVYLALGAVASIGLGVFIWIAA